MVLEVRWWVANGDGVQKKHQRVDCDSLVVVGGRCPSFGAREGQVGSGGGIGQGRQTPSESRRLAGGWWWVTNGTRMFPVHVVMV